MLIMSKIGRTCNNRAFSAEKKPTELRLISAVLGKQKCQLKDLASGSIFILKMD